MRFVIYGAGAIGGVIGVCLHRAGNEVALIARGAHHDAIATSGLTLETPQGKSTHQIPVARDPAALALNRDDVVLLTVKGQDTQSALEALRETAPNDIPVVLCQNGVENERTALRIMPNIYATVVLSPTAHLEPGVVQAFANGPKLGKLDVGRYPTGSDELVTKLTETLDKASFQSFPNPNIMAAKYAKLIDNLINAPQALCGVGAPGLEDLVEEARAEGRAVLDAAGISYSPENPENRLERHFWNGNGAIPGRPIAGGSTWQSLTRGTTLESDYLTGEIVFQARLIGRRAPLNELILDLVHETVRENRRPGWITPEQIRERFMSTSSAIGRRK